MLVMNGILHCSLHITGQTNQVHKYSPYIIWRAQWYKTCSSKRTTVDWKIQPQKSQLHLMECHFGNLETVEWLPCIHKSDMSIWILKNSSTERNNKNTWRRFPPHFSSTKSDTHTYLLMQCKIKPKRHTAVCAPFVTSYQFSDQQPRSEIYPI